MIPPPHPPTDSGIPTSLFKIEASWIRNEILSLLSDLATYETLKQDHNSADKKERECLQQLEKNQTTDRKLECTRDAGKNSPCVPPMIHKEGAPPSDQSAAALAPLLMTLGL